MNDRPDLESSERQKYERIWANPDYRTVSPGQLRLPHFINMAAENGLSPLVYSCRNRSVETSTYKGDGEMQRVEWVQREPRSIIDFGCGSGRASLLFHNLGLPVQMVDIAENALDADVARQIGDRLKTGCLWEPLDDVAYAELGYCCDVMEHIPTGKVEPVLSVISEYSKFCFFSISFEEDNFGKTIGQPLHLTVRPFGWWRMVLLKFGDVLAAKDLISEGLFLIRARS